MASAGLLLLLLPMLAGGCTARTLPLPPPDIQQVTAPDADGMVWVRGLALEGAGVGVYNDADGEGVITSPDGGGCDNSCPFEARVPAQAGDSLRVWQFFETNSTVDTFVPEP